MRERRRSSTSLTRLTGRVVAIVALLGSAAAVAHAQAPGLPVLQSAFFTRGFAVGVNGAGGGGSTVGGALSYSPLAGQLVVVAGAGLLRTEGTSSTTAGFRVAYRFRNFGAERQIAAAIFLGAGSAGKKAEAVVGRAPVGLSVAYRRALGTTRAFAVYASPYYEGTRVKRPNVENVTGGRFRSGLGVDVAVTPSIGAGLGVDVGAAGEAGTTLAAATQFGAGLSYHF